MVLLFTYIVMLYRGTLLIRKRSPLGPYRRPMPRVLGRSWGGKRVHMREVSLQISMVYNTGR